MPTAALTKLFAPTVIGAAVAVSLGVYGALHYPTGIVVSIAGFSSLLTVKVWLTTASFAFALFQLFSALAMWGKILRITGAWLPTAHRWSGRIAFLLSVPVAVHCLYAFGLQYSEPRVLLHSLLGCLFFGAFTIKMLVLPKPGLPGWALPLIGGVVFTALSGVWLTASLWFFTTFGITT